MKGDEERIRAAGCDSYIARPLAYQEFLATVGTSCHPDHPARRKPVERVGRRSWLPTLPAYFSDSPCRRNASSA
jgi:hypothetical protein